MLTCVRCGKSTTCVEKHGKSRVKAVSKWEKLRHFPAFCPPFPRLTRFQTHLFPPSPTSSPRLGRVAKRQRKLARHNVPGNSAPKHVRPVGTTEARVRSIPDFVGFMGSLFEFFMRLLDPSPFPTTDACTLTHSSAKSSFKRQNHPVAAEVRGVLPKYRSAPVSVLRPGAAT